MIPKTLRRVSPLRVALLLALGLSTLSAPARAAETLRDDDPLLAELELANRLLLGYGLGRDTASAAILLQRAAESGDPRAELALARCYVDGTGCERKPELAVSWLQKAVEQDFAPAKAELAIHALRGLGMVRDAVRAARLAREAAEAGNAMAQSLMGELLAGGIGVTRDEHAAIGWFERAAAQGFGDAMVQLGGAYRDGRGVVRDALLAYAWFDIAMAHVSHLPSRAEAARQRDEVALLLLPTDAALARQLSGDWHPGEDLPAKRAAAAAAPSGQRRPLATISPTGQAASQGAKPAAEPAVSVLEKLLTYDIDIRPDGGSATVLHSEMQALDEAALQSITEQPLYFDGTRDVLTVVEAYTLKAGGERVPVEPEAIHTRAVPRAPDLSLFDGRRQKVIVFPSVEPGDTVVFTVRYERQPLISGIFTSSLVFDRRAVQKEVRVTMTAPKAMPLVTETHQLAFAQRETADAIIYEWRYANPTAAIDEEYALEPLDRAPRFVASSAADYAQLVAAYSELVAGKSAVTPKIQSLADEITAGITDRRRQAERLYDWVSRRIRYVAVELGQGAIVPHDAGAILANAYGDCKDHATLFSALLKAKGIASELVLINLGQGFTLPEPPSLAALNHAISYLPEWSLYLDTTARVAPFGVLPFGEYGKPVLHVGGSGPILRRTPAMLGEATTLTAKTSLKLAMDGTVTGESDTIGTGAFAVRLRQAAMSIQATGLEQAARYYLRNAGYSGSGKFAFDSPFDPSSAYRITGQFSLTPRAELLSGASFHLIRGLVVGDTPGDELLGPLDLLDVAGKEPTPCYSGREVQEITLEFPAGKHLRELPRGKDIANQYLVYKSSWSLAGRTLTLRREFVAMADAPVCIGAARRVIAGALNEIRGDYGREIALLDD